MSTTPPTTRREREILQALFASGNRATADQIRQRLSDPPSDSSVRVMLARLERKGLLQHVQEGVRYVYSATRSPSVAKRSAIRELVNTFFDGSALKAASALIGSSQRKLTKAELDELRALFDAARKRGQ